MKNGEQPIANPFVMLREEFDDWAVLFDPDTGRGFGLNPTGVYVWKLLDGEHSVDGMLEAVRRDVPDLPEEAGNHLFKFVEELAQHGLAACVAEQVQEYRGRLATRPAGVSGNVPDAMHFTYEPPQLVDLNSRSARGDCCYNCSPGTSVHQGSCTVTGCCASDCTPGAGADGCNTGSSAGNCQSGGGTGGSGWCDTGSSPTYCRCGHIDYTSGGCNCGWRAGTIEGSICCSSGECYGMPYP